jgi:large conductance mechanosensitive channel
MSSNLDKEMLDELKAIREAVTPKPAPPAPPAPAPKGFIEEFTAFLNKYGIVGLAIAFIMGGATGKLVSALVSDIIMPFITFFIPGGAWQEATLTLGPIVLAGGHFVGAVIDFVIIAFVIFWLMKMVQKTSLK